VTKIILRRDLLHIKDDPLATSDIAHVLAKYDTVCGRRKSCRFGVIPGRNRFSGAGYSVREVMSRGDYVRELERAGVDCRQLKK